MPRPRTIHDFYGFPQELFDFEYPAPGAPDVASEIAETVKPTWCGLDRDQWGLDHGTWSVLTHLNPSADIPVVQLSINALKPLQYHLELGTKLAQLRDRGILILGSGNVVHNLGVVDRARPDTGFDWAERFDDAAVAQLVEDPDSALKLAENRDYDWAVPTPDHFIPLLYVAGVAAVSGDRVEPLVRGYAAGSISMTCYGVGTSLGCRTEAGAASLSRDVPADQANI
jgi:4,5-DOPA dioxygenase extradiol